MEKSYRIHTKIASDTVLNVNMQQDFDFLEVLSLKLRQADAYKLHSSNYGVIVGRVLANDAFGIPNAKVSVFVERDDSDSTELENIYPYTDVTSKDSDDRRYNLLPDYSDDSCYRVVGTFPNKRLLLDDDTQVEVYGKYWKYTTVTNQAGDYMLFGVPTGSQTVHVDLDLSDIGILSQKPRDLIYQGHDETEFDSSTQFKESTNLDNSVLSQIHSQDKSVNVYPFWGDADNGIAAITRNDVQINYKFEPTCVFMGSIISDNDSNSIGHDCRPSKNNGMNDQLIAGNGTIEMIRKTTDGLVEEYAIQGNQLIDENGVWCYQIPMNLDYIGTDEYGNVVATDNADKGIPTRAQVRFRFSKTETGDEGFSRHTAKYLVPMNPIFSEKKVIPTIDEKGSEIEKMYNFGSNTPDSCFRDLYWNNVYSVKNYIPKAQRAHRSYSAYYTALKGANLASDQNEIPFNKLRVDLPFSYMLICILVTIVMWIITFINATFICIINVTLLKLINKLGETCLKIWKFKICPFGFLKVGYIDCISLSAGLTEGNVTYFPGCYCKEGMKDACCAGDSESNNGCDKSCRKSSNTSQFMDKVQRNLALEYKIIKLDFYHDWINGVLYMPLWYWRKRKKKTFLFGLFSKSAKNDFCSCNSTYSRLKTKFACSIGYTDNSLSTKNTKNSMDLGHKKWHKSSYATDTVSFKRGLINPVVNKDGLTAYYYAALQINAAEKNANSTLDDMPSGFTAVRLYATDIILLGNLNEDNLYGIPQFYKCLPSTTANIPPIATVQEEENVSDDDTDYDTSDSEESGVTTTTGMDWGYTGDKQKPLYKDGLFMDLACTSIKTRAKACVNVERLSELGSNLDIQYSVEKPISNQLVKQTFETDGFINKLELDDMDNRAMFATLNHIGFVPQNYQDLHESYTTQIEDENTSYLVNKFKYIYPVNFDGRLDVAMSAWKNGFGQALSDSQDQSYITFRLGAENDEKYKSNSEERIRHFYVKNNGRYALPLYNNSYYFYFGVKKGNTAIDKFNKMFVADCVSSSTSPFTVEFSKQGVSSCPSMYANANNAYGWIKVILDDIQAPYNYTLYDSFNNEVITENDLSLEYFVIGGKSDTSDGDVIVNQDGEIHYQKDDSVLKDSSGHIVTLSNQEYVLEITDSNGKIVSTKIVLTRDNINVEYNTSKLGTKFYNTQDTKVEDICNGDTLNNGIISISSVTIDGYQCSIVSTSMEDITSGSPYTFSIFCHNDDNIFNDNVAINITLEKITSDNSGDTVFDCLCDSGNTYRDSATTLSYSETAVRNWSLFYKDGVVKIYVYQPCTLQATNTISACTNNISYNTITVSNGSTFNTSLNGMPIRFMLGTLNDDINMTVSNQSNFYSTTAITDLTQQRIAGWFAVNDENAYKFPSVNQNNLSIWEDYVTYDSNDISDLESEYDTLVYKFNHMFSLSNAIFVTSNSSETLRYSYNGGVNPILNRTVVPYYSDTDKMLANGTYVLTDDESVSIDKTYPLVVGNNYSGITSSGPQFNSLFKKNTNLLGHYFAAFDRDGGYTSKNKIDSTINVKKLPSYAAVNPKDKFVKTIGTDVTGSVTDFKYVYTQNKGNKINPYLRAMTIDRTLSYNITILPPLSTSMSINTKLDDKNKDADWVCKTARIFGTIYGGIEMAYDSEYNIIDGDVAYDKDNISAVTPNNRLEYTYTVISGQTGDKIACSRYNNRNSSSLTDCIWESDTDRPTSPLIKRFYLAQMGDTDIRNFFWSNFNKTRLTEYINDTESGNTITTRDKKLYLWKYPLTKDGQKAASYNGDFDPFEMNGNFQQSALTSNYPSKRYIDISGIEGTNDCNLQIQSCGYDMSCSYSDTNTLKCTASEGETEEISVTYDSPINFVQTSGDSTVVNAFYQLNTKGSDSEGYSVFESKQLYLNFSYADYSVDDFDVISCCPLLIKILPLTNGIDGVSYYKSVSPIGKGLDEGWASGETTLSAAIKKVTSFAFNVKAKNTFWDRLTNASVILPDSTEIVQTDDVYIKTNHVTTYHFKDTESSSIITNDDDKFSQISFKRTITNSDVKMFAIGVYRFCFSQSGTFATKKIRMFSTTKPYDCRPIRLKVANGESKTYILKESADTYKQFVTFTLKYNKVNNDPVNADCQVFEDKDVEYSCKYNINGTTYQMQLSNPTVTSSSSATYLEFKSEWSQDGMNTFAECKNNKCTCSIYVQGDDNFTYGLSSFTLQATSPQKPTIIGNVIATSVKIS